MSEDIGDDWLFTNFAGSLLCPLCHHPPTEAPEAYFDDSGCAVFKFYCENCHGYSQYFTGQDVDTVGDCRTIAKENLLRAKQPGQLPRNPW